MFQNSAAKLLVPAIRGAMQRRCQSVVSGPPTNHVSTAVSNFDRFSMGYVNPFEGILESYNQ